MSIERLSEFLGSGYKKQYLQRIFLSGQVEKGLGAITPEPVKVVLRGQKLIIFCRSAVQATSLQRKMRQIHAVIKETAPALYQQVDVAVKLNPDS